MLALVSGLSSAKRYARLILMLQAFFDGSTESGTALIFAGYLAPVETWLRFSNDWDKLHAASSRPFKMKNYAKRMDRALLHYRAIERAGLVGIGCAIPLAPLRKVVKELNVDPMWTNPYYLAWRIVITATLQGAEMLGSREPIQFVFDDQSDKNQVLAQWDHVYASASPSIRKRIRGAPDFRKDDDVVALQAADLIAWWARKQYLTDKSTMGKLFPLEWTGGKDATLFFVEMPEKGMRTQFLNDIEFAKKQASQLSLHTTFKHIP
ncbi:MAG TPA: DUF3800 domain-containing protein [Stellaceae bacterium]|nr:DUF3800 domain-containing protein [Stellaceae bacterium]